MDIGGTFTDIVLISEAGLAHTLKVLSSPPDFGRSVVDGLKPLLERTGIEPDALRSVLHGTTVATNAILEGRGAHTGLITTKGFRDVLECGRMRHPSLYDMSWEKPVPIVPRRIRLELDFRIDATGTVIREAQASDVATAAGLLRDDQVESVAVCFINSYANMQAEADVAATLRSLLPGVYVSASVEISPEIKEYERTSTTVVNAYIQPLVEQYLVDFETGLRALGVSAGLQVMQSSGGLIDTSLAQGKPVQLIESGPAAGVIAARALARKIGRENLVSFDMGGTTAKAALIEHGEPFEAAEYEVGGAMNTRHGLTRGGGYTLRVPSVDISEVGAGGGSICWIDSGGAARVGPQSAGADPGPACYGRGGTAPTLTDANVVLGYVNPRQIAGGTQLIDADLARAALADHFADPLGMDLLDAAYGVFRIAVAGMSKAIKAVTSQRGRDPRDFTLVAFGGAGPAYAAAMAAEFEIDTVVVPPNPGLFSAIGLLVGDVQQHAVTSLTRRTDLDPANLTRQFQELEAELRDRFSRGGYAQESVILERFANARYRGQSSELRVPVRQGAITGEALDDLYECFELEHERTFGYRGSRQLTEVLNLRVRARYTPPGPDAGKIFAARPTGQDDTPASAREAYFGPNIGLLDTPVTSRWALNAQTCAGPLIIEDMDATALVPPDWQVRLDDFGDLVLERRR